LSGKDAAEHKEGARPSCAGFCEETIHHGSTATGWGSPGRDGSTQEIPSGEVGVDRQRFVSDEDKEKKQKLLNKRGS